MISGYQPDVIENGVEKRCRQSASYSEHINASKSLVIREIQMKPQWDTLITPTRLIYKSKSRRKQRITRVWGKL